MHVVALGVGLGVGTRVGGGVGVGVGTGVGGVGAGVTIRHIDAPTFRFVKRPLGHAAHLLLYVKPENFECGQTVHEADLGFGEYVPAGQNEHSTAPPLEKVPGRQSAAQFEEFPPWTGPLRVPGAQGPWHTADTSPARP